MSATMLLSCLLLVSGLAGCSQEESSSADITMTILEEPPDASSCIRFVDETTATPTWHLLFSTDETVTNVQLLTLDESETQGDALYTLDKLTPDKPLVVSTYINDATINRGVSYVDDNGATHIYSIIYSLFAILFV